MTPAPKRLRRGDIVFYFVPSRRAMVAATVCSNARNDTAVIEVGRRRFRTRKSKLARGT